VRAGDNSAWKIFTTSRTKTEKDIGSVARSSFHRHTQTLSSFFQTSFPLTHVLSTFPLRSRTTKSASAPGRSVPFRFSMPRHRAGLKVTHFIASPSEHPVNREKFRTQLSRVTTLRQIFSCTKIVRRRWARRTCQRGCRCPQDTAWSLPSRNACRRATHALRLLGADPGFSWLRPFS